MKVAATPGVAEKGVDVDLFETLLNDPEAMHLEDSEIVALVDELGADVKEVPNSSFSDLDLEVRQKGASVGDATSVFRHSVAPRREELLKQVFTILLKMQAENEGGPPSKSLGAQGLWPLVTFADIEVQLKDWPAVFGNLLQDRYLDPDAGVDEAQFQGVRRG